MPLYFDNKFGGRSRILELDCCYCQGPIRPEEENFYLALGGTFYEKNYHAYHIHCEQKATEAFSLWM